jgi:hypothetical protein
VGDFLAIMADTASDPVETVLKELVGWAEQAERTGRRLGGDADEARLLLGLLRDYLVDAELTAWLDLRGAEAAAEELLQTVAAGSAADRLFATVLATLIGAAAEPQWREALDDLPLRPYAKVAIAEFAEAGSPNARTDVEPTPEDLAWLLTDAIAAICRALEPDEAAARPPSSQPPGRRRIDDQRPGWSASALGGR